MDMIKLVSDFKRNNSSLWVEQNIIKLFVADHFKSDELKTSISRHKPAIVEFLLYNDIFSKEDFIKRKIFRTAGKAAVLSFAQQRLWFVEQYEGGSSAYHMPSMFELHPAADSSAIRYALQQVVSRHEVLRTTIAQSADGVKSLQYVHDLPLDIDEVLLDETADRIAIIRKDIKQPFDLSAEYPLRVKIYSQGISRVLLINMHHIASDGWSIDVFHRELLSFYTAYSKGDFGFALPPLEIQYKDFAAWQRNYLTGEELEEQLHYWRTKLAGFQPLALPTDYSRPPEIDYNGESLGFRFDADIAEKARTLAQTHGATLHTVLLSGLHILLGKYSGQLDIVTGSPIANRHHRQTRELIGFFVNTQVNRSLLAAQQTFGELVAQLHEDQIAAQQYQDLPFEKLVEDLQLERDASRQPIFQVMFGVQSFGNDQDATEQQSDDFQPFQSELTYDVAKFDLSIFIDDSAQELIVQVDFATSLFTRSTITRLIGHYRHLLEQLLSNPRTPYSQLSLLAPEEYNKIVHEWNVTERSYPSELPFPCLFQQQAARTPDKIALVYEEQQLTYQQLNERSNQLARHIREQYLERTGRELLPDTLIALCLDRSLEMVIAMLAVLKAGAAYVPIDPGYPQQRIDYIIEDTGAALVIDGEEIGSVREQDSSNLPQYNRIDDLAYVIYTSGTTGRPKGAMIEHRGMINHLYAKINELSIDGNSVVALTAAYTFDISIWQALSALLVGGRTVGYSGDRVLTPVRLLEAMQGDGVTIWECVPSYLSSVLSEPALPALPALRCVLTTGEAVSQQLIGEWFGRYPEKAVINAYGPTEASDDICHHRMTEVPAAGGVPIGKPVQNMRIYILDGARQVCPLGVAGELWVSGVGVGRGYWNKPELTAERFIANPFAKDPALSGPASPNPAPTRGDGLLYRTGDLARWLPDGTIEYLGRLDEQVKIRGYRIELGEIEAVLRQVPELTDCVVLAKEDHQNNKRLIAYVVAKDDYDQAAALRYAQTQLPEYMVPSAWVRLAALPLTANGKIDRRALPDPELGAESTYLAPTTAIEITLCAIWAEVLGLPRVGITDDFFRIGGDSILSIQVSSRIRQAGYTCQVKEIFEHRTVSQLTQHLQTKAPEAQVQTEQGLLQGELGLLPAQQWFVEQVERGAFGQPHHWNQSFLIKVPTLDLQRLTNALQQLVTYHDALRIRYSGWKQRYQPSITPPELKQLDVSQYSEAEQQRELTEWQSHFDLEQGPLFQPGYLYGYADGSARIYLALHHLIVDGVSWRILADDLKTLYHGKHLPPKGSSYRQWVASVARYGEQHPEEAAYWATQLKEIRDQPIQAPEPRTAASFTLSATATRSLLQHAPAAYHTEINDLLLTALGYALQEQNGRAIQAITLEGHGRESIDEHLDHSRTVGWFTSFYPVRLELKENLSASICAVKEGLRKLPNKGLGFGAFATRPESGYTFADLPTVSFNYLGQFDTTASTTGRDATAHWRLVAEPSGRSSAPSNEEPYLIELNGGVSEGQLSFDIETWLGRTATEKLSASLQRHLLTIITHCEEQLATAGPRHTPSDFEGVRVSGELLQQLEQEAHQARNAIEQLYPATSLQQGFLYHALSQPRDDAYQIQFLFDYHGQLDIETYLRAWKYCIAQYPSLRTAFNWQEELLQVIYTQGRPDYEVHDLSHLSEADREAAIRAIQQKDRQRGFDLRRPTLLRLQLIKHSEDYYTIIKNAHHSITDGWSSPVLLNSVHSCYEALRINKAPTQQKDEAYEKTQRYIREQKGSIGEYWTRTLAGVESANDISALLSEPIALTSYQQVEDPQAVALQLTGESYQKLKALSRREGITISVIVQFLWHKLLQVYSNSKQTIVGTTVSGRDLPIEGIELSVGLYINTLPLVAHWDNDHSILEQLRQMQQEVAEMNAHSFASLASLQRNGERLFHSLLVHENYPLPTVAEEGHVLSKLSVREVIEKVDYPLNVLAYEQDNALTLRLHYDGKYLDKEKAQGHLSAMERIAQQLLAHPDKPHRQLSLLTPEAYQEIVYEKNATAQVYPSTTPVYLLFEQQAARTPDKIALVYEEQQLTYQQLNERSNQLARQIRTQCPDLKPDTLIALCLDRSLGLVVAILGVLKAGGAYVPIDPAYPQDRIDYILEDTGATLLIDEQYIHTATEQAGANLPPYSTAADLAYVLYTSGTTGRPKGVLQTHGNITRLFSCTEHQFGFNANDVWTLFHSYVFDFTVWELWGALLYGGKLIVVGSEQIRDIDAFYELCVRHQVTVLNQTPSMFYRFAEKAAAADKDLPLRYIIFGGEALNIHQLRPWWAFQSRRGLTTRLINMFGITETTVHVTYKQLMPEERVVSNIGKPLADMKAYVLDAGGCPVPVGVAGELYIGGAGLARGYWRRPELTAERFIANPFAKDPALGGPASASGEDRLYRTGDLVRWLPDGDLEYIGRNDEQVKIRGHRIELGEIEHALSQQEGIRQCCVLARQRKTVDGNSKYLVGYYVVADEGTALDQTTLLQRLAQQLPEYMVPAALVMMSSFPLTINGKLDRRALPDPELGAESTYLAPTTAIEITLCAIWAEVLGLPRVGITDNFFRIGGDSILSIQVSSRIRQAGYACQVKEIFEHRTVSGLAQHLRNKAPEAQVQTEQDLLQGELGLLPIQRWFVEQVECGAFGQPHHWNQSFLIKVPTLDLQRLTHALQELVTYHDALRIRYNQWEQTYQQRIIPPELKQLDISQYSEAEVQSILTSWQSRFDLEQGPLFQPGYLHGYADGSARIYLALHHLIVDGVSWRILADDLKTLYHGKHLPPKGSSYRQWVASVARYGEQHPEEAAYWATQLKEIGDQPIQAPEPRTTASFTLSATATRSLLQHAPAAYHTEINDLLLTALGYALQEQNGKAIQAITLEGHGRESIDEHLDHSRTVGWFTSLYPVQLEAKENLSASICAVKEGLRKLPNKGLGFGVFATCPESGYTFADLPTVSFNYLGQFDTAVAANDWQLAAEPSGNNIASSNQYPYLVNINGGVSAGQLSFDVETWLGKTTTEKLSASLQRHLLTIITHCEEQLATAGPRHTPSDFEGVRISEELLQQLEQEAHQARNAIEQLYPATSLQQGFLYHALSQPHDDAYQTQLLFDYHGQLDIETYLRAWKYCIAQYPALRTAFNWQEELLQVVYTQGRPDYEVHDLSHLSEADREAAIRAIQQKDRQRGFDLRRPTLLRLQLIKHSEAYYTILLNEHHGITDGWSNPVLLNSIHSCYEALLVSKLPTQQKDEAYEKTQRYIRNHKGFIDKYWTKTLSGIEAANDIAALLSEPIVLDSYKQVEDPQAVALQLAGESYQKLKALSRREGITISVIVQFLWHKLLQVYSNSKQTIVGTTVSGRDLPIEGIELSVGLYINTLPLVAHWDNDHSILEQLREMQQQVTAITTHSFAHLARLQREGERLFHSLLVYENYPLPEEKGDGHVLSKLSIREVIEKGEYPVNILAYEYASTLTIKLQYDGSYLREEKAQGHLSAMERIAQQLLAHPDKPHRQLSLLAPGEYDQLVYQWNATEQPYPADKTVHALFEQQAARNPNSIALVYEEQQLTYKELNERSNQLARQIRTQCPDLKPDTLIALKLDRSLEMVIAMLAVLKAGGAYVPIDPGYPQHRIDYILEDTGAALLIDEQYSNTATEQDHTNLPPYSTATDLAYVIYTSGTTGRPKGVEITHGSLSHLVHVQQEKLGITARSNVLQYAALVFDASVWETFSALSLGATLFIASPAVRQDGHQLVACLEAHKITLATLPPALLTVMPYKQLPHLATLVVAGEPCRQEVMDQWSEGRQLINAYGPTENTVCATLYPYRQGDRNTNIGKPLPNMQTYVLDAGGSPVPVGVAGELYIGGAGLARGYWRRPELTAERFIVNPFGKDNGRLYKTGDLVRWLADGNIEYLGRTDEQVKIRGHRIELGEIEAVLRQVPEITDCVVIAKEDPQQNKRLIAYLVTAEPYDQQAVLQYAQAQLPEYMIPSALVRLPSLPLTISGKLDKQALPDPELGPTAATYVAPGTTTETALCAIWAEVLGLKQVGITDNFFRIGGNSILAIQVSHRMSKILGFEVKVADLFKAKSIAALLERTLVGVDEDNEEWVFEA